MIGLLVVCFTVPTVAFSVNLTTMSMRAATRPIDVVTSYMIGVPSHSAKDSFGDEPTPVRERGDVETMPVFESTQAYALKTFLLRSEKERTPVSMLKSDRKVSFKNQNEWYP